MFPDRDPAIDAAADARRHGRPHRLRVESDGTGSASFGWTCVLDALTRGIEHDLRGALDHDVDILGVRFVDADGRAVTGPAPAGVMLVGFTTRH